MTLFRMCRIFIPVWAIFFCFHSAPAQTPPRTLLAGHLRTAVTNLPPLGHLDGATRLKLSLHLPLHHRADLSALVDQLYDPTSPSYHHYLTTDDFNAQFGPTAAEYQAVIDFATRQGFTVTKRHANRLLLEVSAPVTNIEHAFQIGLRTYRHPTELRNFFAPDTEPSIESGIPVDYIGGLDNFSRAHPQNLRRTPIKSARRATPQDIGSGPNGNLAGTDYRAAYVPGTSLTGAGQSVGLVEFDGYYPNDITDYENETGVPHVPLQKVLLDGFDGIPTSGSDSANGEVALDIEMTTSMAPGLTEVIVYEDDPNNGLFNNVLQAMSENTTIKQFSCSWAFPSISNPQRVTMDGYFLQMAAQGQSFFASSGDSGVYTGAVDAPDDDPYVTLVGGTALAAVGGAWQSETAWNTEEGPGVDLTSGGISTSYPIPTWQKGVSMTLNHGSTSQRNCPDVAMVADNIFIVADDGHAETTGGTSAAAPLWAGLAALANQQAVAASLPTIGFINPALYHLGTNSSYHACFDDITSGNNTNNSSTKFLAVPGYDLCTGWGSPSGSSLINALTLPDGFQITPGRGFVANGPVGGPFTITTQTFTLTNNGAAAFNWSFGNVPNWLDVSAAPGSLTTAGAAANVTLTLNASANSLSSGMYTANIWFTNLTSGLPQLRQFTLEVGQNLVLDGGFETGDFSYWTLTGGLGIYTNNFVDYNGDPDGTGYSSYAGNCFAALGQIGNVAYLSQTLPTQPGQVYQISFWLENPAGGLPNECQVQWNGTATNMVFNQSNLGNFGWSNLVFNVQATTNLTTLKLGFENASDFFVLDNVSVTAVAAPVIITANALPGGAFDAPYYQQLSATGGTAPYTWTLSAGTLPLGLILESDGLILGTPTVGTTASFTVQATGQDGLSSTQTFSLKITPPDTTRPTLTITSPKSGAKESNDVFTVTGTSADNVAVSNVFVSVNGGVPSQATLANGNWSEQVSLSPGTNLISAYAVDTSGNLSLTNSVKLDYILSTTLTVRANGEGTISPDYNGATLQISNLYTMTAKPASGFGFVGWTDGNGNPVTNGATLKFVMTSNLTFVANFADDTKPTLTLTSPKSGAKESNSVFTVTGTAKDNVAVSNVLVSVNGAPGTAATLANGNWNELVTLLPGTNTIAAYAVDTAGNASLTTTVKLDYVLSARLTVRTNGDGTFSPAYNGATLQISNLYTLTAKPATGFGFVNWTDGNGNAITNGDTLKFVMVSNLTYVANFADDTKPTLTITSPKTGAKDSNELVTVTGTAKDNVAVSNVLVSVNGAPGGLANLANGTWSEQIALLPGTNTIAAYAVDTAGNVSLTTTVKLDYVLSAVMSVQIVGSGTVTPNYNNALLAIGSTYTMKAAADKGFAFYYWGGDVLTSNVSLSFTMTSGLTVTANFKDITPPTVSITEPTAKLRVSNTVVTASGKASDNVAVTEVDVRINQGDWLPATGTSNWVAAGLTVSSGTNTLEAIALDAAGNISATNTVKFIGVLPPNWAPDSLSGSTVQITPFSSSPATLSLGTTNFSFVNTNDLANSGVGAYLYTVNSTNSAELNFAFEAPPSVTNAQDVQFTWTNVDTGTFTNITTADSGTFTVTPSTNSLPTTWSGHKLTTTANGGGSATNSFTSATAITIGSTGSSATGNYEVVNLSPDSAFLGITYTDVADAGKVAYVQLTFTSKTEGAYVENIFDGVNPVPVTTSGTFTWK